MRTHPTDDSRLTEFQRIVSAASTTSEILESLHACQALGPDMIAPYFKVIVQHSRVFDTQLLRKLISSRSFDRWEALSANPFLDERHVAWLINRASGLGMGWATVRRIVFIAARRGALNLSESAVADLYRLIESSSDRSTWSEKERTIDAIHDGLWSGEQSSAVFEQYRKLFTSMPGAPIDSTPTISDWAGEEIVRHALTSTQAFVRVYNAWPSPGLAIAAAKRSLAPRAPYCLNSESRSILTATMMSGAEDDVRAIPLALILTTTPADIGIAVDRFLTRYGPGGIALHPKMTDEALAMLEPRHRTQFLQSPDAEVRTRMLVALRAEPSLTRSGTTEPSGPLDLPEPVARMTESGSRARKTGATS